MTGTWSTWSYLADWPGLLLVAAFALWIALDRTLARWEREEQREERDR